MDKNYKEILNIKEIQNILPHRYPFLFLDRIVSLDLEKEEIVGQKNLTMNEYFFQGHFPSAPIMPGVLVLEALAQTGGILVHQKGYVKKVAVLLNVAKAKFRLPIKPGDTMYLHVKAIHVSHTGGKVEGKVFVNNKLAVEAELSFALVEKEQL